MKVTSKFCGTKILGRPPNFYTRKMMHHMEKQCYFQYRYVIYKQKYGEFMSTLQILTPTKILGISVPQWVH